jgi:hypothetical protein
MRWGSPVRSWSLEVSDVQLVRGHGCPVWGGHNPATAGLQRPPRYSTPFQPSHGKGSGEAWGAPLLSKWDQGRPEGCGRRGPRGASIQLESHQHGRDALVCHVEAPGLGTQKAMDMRQSVTGANVWGPWAATTHLCRPQALLRQLSREISQADDASQAVTRVAPSKPA